jgi:GDP-4-dehydro-6-deoxy-D-mannose reductase
LIPSRVLVTGASGFVGGHMLPALREAFPAARLIAGVHRRAVPGWDEGVSLALHDEPTLRDALASARPDAVLHLAAQANVAESFQDPAATRAANTDGTLNLARAILGAVPECRLVFASTGEVYGLSFRDGPAREDTPFQPTNPYAEAKAAADAALGDMAGKGLRVLRMRPLNHVGPGQSRGYVLTEFARQVALFEAGRPEYPTLRVGALDRWRDFLDVRDVCAGYALALERFDTIESGTAINLASGTPRRVGDMLDSLLAMAGISPVIEEVPAALRPNDVIRTQGDASRAHAVLGWAPRIAWDDTLKAVLDDWRGRIV